MNERKILDWGEINEPWWETEGFTQLLLDKVNILDILDRYEIEYTRTLAGNFDYKLRCPFPNHQGGQERTASLCVSSSENNFYCYGCHNHGNPINFLIYYKSMVYYAAVKELAQIAGITEDDCKNIDFKPREVVRPEHTIMPYIFQVGIEIREYLANIKDDKQYIRWETWAQDQFRKMDKMLNTLKDNDWKKVKRYQLKINAYLKEQKR